MRAKKAAKKPRCEITVENATNAEWTAAIKLMAGVATGDMRISPRYAETVFRKDALRKDLGGLR